jgi:hypothetical protein
MRTRKVWIAPLLLGVLWGCGGSQPDLKAKEYKGMFQDKAAGLSLRCPEKWEIRENVEGHRVIARSPLESRQDNFQENLVVTGPIQAGTVEEALAAVETDLQGKLDGYKKLDSSVPGALAYTHLLKGVALQCRAHFQPNPKGGFWLLLFTSTTADFNRFQGEFDGIVATFGQPLPEITPSPTPGASSSPTTAPTAGQVEVPPESTPAGATATPAPASATPAQASATPAVAPATPAAPAATTPAPAAATPAAVATPLPGATATPARSPAPPTATP